MVTTMLYSKSRPDGYTFSAESLDELSALEARMAKEGWVDNPAKIGHNAWNTDDPQVLARIGALACAHRNGAIPALDPKQGTDLDTAEREFAERAAQEAQAAKEAAHQGMREPETPAQKAREAAEKLADHTSDAGLDNLPKAEGEKPLNPVDAANPVEQTLSRPEQIEAAIGRLGDADFGKTGVPHVKAIERELGYGINMSERNKAWAAMGEKRPEADGGGTDL